MVRARDRAVDLVYVIEDAIAADRRRRDYGAQRKEVVAIVIAALVEERKCRIFS